MTVWIVLEYYGHEGSALRGAFSSYDRALAFAKDRASEKHNSVMWDLYYDIWDEEVDKPVISPYA